MDNLDVIARCTGFEWDDHNAEKIFLKHRVTPAQAEQVFFNRPILVAGDEKHSEREKRYYALGQSDEGLRLFVVFTIRGDLIRVISARDMHRKEREVYQSHEENSQI